MWGSLSLSINLKELPQIKFLIDHGVTKKNKWVRISRSVDMLDTPRNFNEKTNIARKHKVIYNRKYQG